MVSTDSVSKGELMLNNKDKSTDCVYVADDTDMTLLSFSGDVSGCWLVLATLSPGLACFSPTLATRVSPDKATHMTRIKQVPYHSEGD